MILYWLAMILMRVASSRPITMHALESNISDLRSTFLELEWLVDLKGFFLVKESIHWQWLVSADFRELSLVVLSTEEDHILALATGSHLNDAGRYRRLVDRLIYCTITRLNLCYARHILSCLMQAPQHEHMNANYKVLPYIKGSP